MSSAVHILIIDECAASLVAMRDLLAPLGHPVSQARSGDEALELLLEGHFACILLEVRRPGPEGLETAWLLRRHERTRPIPLVLLSELYREEAHMLQGYEHGASDCIPRPFNPDLLRARVKALVGLYLEGEGRRRRESSLLQLAREEKERALQSQSRVTRTLANNATLALFMMDARQHCTFMNPAAERMTGFTLAEVQGRALHDLLHHTRPDGTPYPISECPIDRALPTKAQEEGEDIFIHRDGTFYPVAFTASPIIEEGVPVGTVIEVRDTTEEKRAEREREEFLAQAQAARAEAEAQRAWLYDILMEAPAAISIRKGPEQVFTLANPLYQRLAGGRELLGRPLREALQGLSRSSLELSEAVYRTGEPFTGTEMPVELEGGRRYLNLVIQPLRDARGQVDSVMSFAVDVTEQVEARERLEALARDLRQSEEQFRTLADSIPQLAWMADGEGFIFWYNQRWYDYTGTTFEEMKGWGWKAVHDPKDVERVEANYRRALLEEGRPWADEFRLRGRDGRFRWFLSRAMPVRDATGRIVRWFGTNTDVEDQRQQAAELREAVQARDTFLSIASHELKTPLTPLSLKLQSFARALESEPDTAWARRWGRDVEVMRRQVKRLAVLVEDLLDVARIGTGRLRLEPEPVDLSALIREVVARFEAEAERAGCRLEVRGGGELVGRWDRLRLEQVVSNLLANAIKYGAGKPIHIDVESAGQRARLVVRDEGIGIAPEALTRIFEKFERAVSERHYGGLGLGLYVSRQIIEAMGGTVRAESALGAGATFTVELPLTGGPEGGP